MLASWGRHVCVDLSVGTGFMWSWVNTEAGLVHYPLCPHSALRGGGLLKPGVSGWGLLYLESSSSTHSLPPCPPLPILGLKTEFTGTEFRCELLWGTHVATDHILTSYAQSLQSCPTPCDPMDCSPPGSSVHGVLQARTLEWVAIFFSNLPRS